MRHFSLRCNNILITRITKKSRYIQGRLSSYVPLNYIGRICTAAKVLRRQENERWHIILPRGLLPLSSFAQYGELHSETSRCGRLRVPFAFCPDAHRHTEAATSAILVDMPSDIPIPLRVCLRISPTVKILGQLVHICRRRMTEIVKPNMRHIVVPKELRKVICDTLGAHRRSVCFWLSQDGYHNMVARTIPKAPFAFVEVIAAFEKRIVLPLLLEVSCLAILLEPFP